MRHHKLVLSAALAAGTMVAGTATAAEIRLMTGPQGGSWYPLGGAIKGIVEANVPGSSVQVLPGAGIANIQGIEGGRADMGFGNSVSTVDAINGNEPFPAPAQNTCNVATLYPQYFQVVALRDSGVNEAQDLKGKALAIQPRGNTAEQITREMLQAAGLTYDDMRQVSQGSYTDSVNLLRDGNADAFTLGTTIPAGAVMDLISARQVTFVPIEGELFDKMKEINPGYTALTIPAGTYPGQEADVPTIGYATHLIARCDLDEDLIYGMLRSLHENLGDLEAITSAMRGLTPDAMAEDIGVPLHPGAERFYREQGVI
jgi:TRAP transporter TAXI family solute receptor